MDDSARQKRQKKNQGQMKIRRFKAALRVEKKPPQGDGVNDRLEDRISDRKSVLISNEPEQPVAQDDVNGRIGHREIEEPLCIQYPLQMPAIVRTDITAAERRQDGNND